MKGENFDVYDALKPICWISKAFGVFPCKLDGSKSGGLEFGIMLVNLILHSVIFYLSFFHYHVNLNYNRQYLLMSVIENVLDLLCITSCIFNVTLIYKTRRNIFEALRRICAVEMILNSLGGRTDYKPVRNYHIVYFTFHLIVLISLYQGKFFVYFDVTLLPSKATSFLKSVVSALILAGFCTMLFAIRQLCDTLVSLCNPRLICRLYLDICEICKFLTNGYESVLIVQFLGNFAGLLSCTFYIVQAWNGGGTNTELLFQIAWFLFNILKIFVCLKGCVDTTKKVNDLWKIAQNSHGNDLEVKQMVNQILLQKYHISANFTLANAQRIDYSFLQVLISTVSTYVVFCVQFNQDMVDKK